MQGSVVKGGGATDVNQEEEEEEKEDGGRTGMPPKGAEAPRIGGTGRRPLQ